MQFISDHILSIVNNYKGQLPLSLFLKGYFKTFPKLGSRDRKAISEAVYIYYRFARFFAIDQPVLPVILYGLQQNISRNVLLQKIFQPEQATQNLPLKPLSSVIQPPLAAGLTPDKWLSALRQQPRLFIRLRKNKNQIIAALDDHEIEYGIAPKSTSYKNDPQQNVDCLSVANGSAVDKILNESAYVVQDWASQESMYKVMAVLHTAPKTVWDVCSGAGGKSIFLKDKLTPFELLATDVRASILHNLKMRFRQYGLKGAQTQVLNSADPASVVAHLKERRFDLVLCDVPCSGSGTWARNPEQFHFFKEQDLSKFEQLQYPIAYNAQQYLADNGIFAYVTCSVFVKENEDVVNKLLQNTTLSLISMELIDGIDHKADCMFVALFRKELIVV